MKILWVSHLLPFPPKAGVIIRSYNNLKELSKYHEVYFVGLYQTVHQPDSKDVEEAEKNIKKICKNVIVLPFESYQSRFSWCLLVIRSIFSFKSYKEAWCRSKRMAESIKVILEKESIDIVHFDTISLLQYHNILPYRKAIVINHHNIESHMMFRRFSNERNWLLKLYCYLEAFKLRKLEKKYCNKGINLVVSKMDRDRLMKIVPSSRCAIIPNGVNTNYFQRIKVPEISNSIIFVGGLTWYPNIDAVMFFCKEIWPLLIKHTENAHFFVIGRTSPESLKVLSNIDNRIHLKGFIEDIRPMMSSATCYVCPMKTGGGTRLKVLDALAMGVPLVASKMACEGVNVKDNESVLLAESPEGFVEKILTLFNDSRLREKLRQNSRKLVEREYDYAKIGIKLKECFEREHDLIKQ